MCAHSSLGADQRDVDEGLGVQQRFEGAQQVRLVVVPAEAVVLLTADGSRLVVHRGRRCPRVCRSREQNRGGRVRGLAPPSVRSHPSLQPFRLRSSSRRTAILASHSFRVHKTDRSKSGDTKSFQLSGTVRTHWVQRRSEVVGTAVLAALRSADVCRGCGARAE